MNDDIVSALTVDVEDYFQVSGFEAVVSPASWGSFESRVERNTDRLLDILADARVIATFFILGWTAERFPQLVRRIQAAGHELGSHSYAHRLVYLCSQREFREDTRRAKKVVEDISGEEVIGYRAPSFSITRKSLWALEILAEEGFHYDSSIFPIRRDRYGIPAAPRHPFQVILRNGQPTPGASEHKRANAVLSKAIVEVPPSTIPLFRMTLPIGGGGYFRLCPPLLFHRAIGRIVEGERRPTVLYIHPWELDPQQPRFRNGSWLSRFRHYLNLEKTEKRLKSLLARWQFTSVIDLLARLPEIPQLSLEEIPSRASRRSLR